MTLLEATDTYSVSQIDFLKIDIEGHEIVLINHFFDHAPKLRFPILVLMEMKHDEKQADELHSRMISEGYEVTFQTQNNRIYSLNDKE